MNAQKKRLLGLTPAELKEVVGSLSMPGFTARQPGQSPCAHPSALALLACHTPAETRSVRDGLV
jgi:hypothetical protein